jgi:sulfite exporter TauE/SafE
MSTDSMSTGIAELGTFLALALAGSFHCVGMCGPFAIAASAPPAGLSRRGGIAGRQVLYHLGKTTSYLFLAALVGSGGSALAAVGSSWRQTLALGSALILGWIGLHGLGVLARPIGGGAAHRVFAAIAATLGSIRGALIGLPVPVRPLAFGILSGFLPCPLVWALLAAGSARGSVIDALLAALALGLGTMPALIALTLSGKVLSPRVRLRVGRLAGVAMLGLAVYTAYRGFRPLPCCNGVEIPASRPACDPSSACNSSSAEKLTIEPAAHP